MTSLSSNPHRTARRHAFPVLLSLFLLLGCDDASDPVDGGPAGSDAGATDAGGAGPGMAIPQLSGTLANVDGTPSATGFVAIGLDADGTAVITLGADFAQEMGPGDTEVRLARSAENVADQIAADASSVSDSLGIIPNGASGSFTFALPAGLDPTSFSHVIIWCPTAAVNFGAGAISGSTGTFTNVDGTPAATGGVTVALGADGDVVVSLADDFMLEMGPGDVEILLAQSDENAADQRAADASSVSPALGIVPNGTSGARVLTGTTGVDPSAFSHIIVWCPTAAVNFGVSALEAN